MKPGPKRGHGGRPRKRTGSRNKGGYLLTTVGPKGRGVRRYLHRVVAAGGRAGGRKTIPKSSKSTRSVVHHVNHNRSADNRGNLRTVSRSYNNSH